MASIKAIMPEENILITAIYTYYLLVKMSLLKIPESFKTYDTMMLLVYMSRLQNFQHEGKPSLNFQVKPC